MVGFLVVENNPHFDPSWPEVPDKYIHMQVCSHSTITLNLHETLLLFRI